jgi:hypothetical protein
LKAALVIIVITAAVIIGLVIFIRSKMASAGKRWMAMLKQHATFSEKSREKYADMQFHYSGMENENLKKLRETYGLETVAGSGSKTEQIINLMKWVNRLTWHHPNPKLPGPYNALHLIEISQGWKRGINCWMYALILNEVYLSMGFASRLVHLEPASNVDKESHFVTSVYSKELERWLYMDPDFGGYFTDEAGNLLGIAEIRQRLIAGQPLLPNRDVKGFTIVLGKGSYAWYLSKNSFRYTCSQRSEFDQETIRKDKLYYGLIPDSFEEKLLLEPQTTARGNTIIYVNDEELFWQKP